jgi:enoyl-[acyl-carrier protein] reductase II
MNRVTKLFEIKYPIIQGGMVWVSGAKLAAAVSNAGGLGLIGAGSMKPELLKVHITKAQSLTNNPIGVNVPLLYEKSKEQIDMALSLGIKIFFTSAGSPKKFTSYLKDHGANVVHVVSTPEHALTCEEDIMDVMKLRLFHLSHRFEK